jgi:hypothetical protein
MLAATIPNRALTVVRIPRPDWVSVELLGPVGWLSPPMGFPAPARGSPVDGKAYRPGVSRQRHHRTSQMAFGWISTWSPAD